MATKINKKNLLALCSPKKNVTVKSEAKVVLSKGKKEASEKYSAAGKKAWETRRKKEGSKSETIKPQFVGKEFTNYHGEGKDNARNFICKNIKESGVLFGNVMCLPAAYCLLELKIHNEVSNLFTYIACERLQKTFVKMVQTIKKNNLLMFSRLGDLRSAIYSAAENSYSHILLDYCGILTTFKEEILYITRKNIVRVGGTIITTVEKARDKRIIVGMGIKKETKNMSKTERSIKKFFRSIDGYEMVDTFQYDDSSPMMVVVLKRIK